MSPLILGNDSNRREPAKETRQSRASFAPGGLRPPGPPDAIGAALSAPVQRRFRRGGRRGVSFNPCFLGRWVIGEAVFWRSPNAALCGGIGGAQRIREVGSATLLRLVAPPRVTAAHRLLAPAVPFCVLLLCPSILGSLWAGNQVTGGTGERDAGERR